MAFPCVLGRRFTCIVVLLASSASVHAVKYPNYERLLASQKLDIISDYIQGIKDSPIYEAPATSAVSSREDSANAYGAGYVSNCFGIDAVEFAPSLGKVLDIGKTKKTSVENEVEDPEPEVDYSIVDDLRPKNMQESIRHSQRDIVQVEFVFNSVRNYTGLFQGSRFAFASFSYTSTYTGDLSNIALKLLRDGQPSANLLFLPACKRNDEWQSFFSVRSRRFSFEKKPELFQTTFSNHPRQFMCGTKTVWHNHLGLRSMAQFTESCEKVSDKEILFPYQIRLQPTATMKECSSLTKLKKGDVLYSIFASSDPKDGVLHPMGTIRFKRNFSKLSSDTTLFFRDHPFKEDLKHRPDWKYDALGAIDDDCKFAP